MCILLANRPANALPIVVLPTPGEPVMRKMGVIGSSVVFVEISIDSYSCVCYNSHKVVYGKRCTGVNSYQFWWDEENIEHIANHGVEPLEAEYAKTA